MKVAFTSDGNDLNAALDIRFGRAPQFLVYDLDTDTYDIVGNQQSLDAAQGAGVQAAETVARLGVTGVVTGHCDPKAFRVLSVAGINVYSTDAPTVGEALNRFRAGELVIAEAANTEGHWV